MATLRGRSDLVRERQVADGFDADADGVAGDVG